MNVCVARSGTRIREKLTRAALVCALAAGALAVGDLGVGGTARAAEPDATGVEGLGSAIENHVAPLPSETAARVVVRAHELAAISAELNARITYLPPREGDRFRKGDVLVEFDCRRFTAEHDAAEAAMKAYEAAYRNEKKLLEYKSTGTAAVEQAYHQFERAKAELRGFAVRLDACKILAPFDGRVTEKIAQVHEIAQPNQPLIRILNEERMDLLLMVPSNWLPMLAHQPIFNVAIDETGQSHKARIVQTTGQIDPVSQSVRVIAELVEPSRSILAGMSGTATFAQQRAEQ